MYCIHVVSYVVCNYSVHPKVISKERLDSESKQGSTNRIAYISNAVFSYAISVPVQYDPGINENNTALTSQRLMAIIARTANCTAGKGQHSSDGF